MAPPRSREPGAHGRRRKRTASRRSLAKLTRPRLHAAYSRERLFRLLDDARASPLVWIAGPPGAGKTTLAATWLEARRLGAIWYQLDAGDADPATFFYYLRRAADAAGIATKTSLPLLTGEYQHDIPAFAHRWFRELFSRLPREAVVALDGYQDVGAESPLHRVLAAACEEVPDGVQLLVTSWGEPPAELSRAVAQEKVARVAPDELRLTLDEAEAIAADRDALTRDDIRELHARSGGWAAGFTLLRERTRRTGLVNRVDERATMREVFDYFMALVFRDMPAQSRDALIETALFPRFTDAMAIELTGNPGVARLVDDLYRRHLFVERRYGSEITYQYHVLVRAFLLDQARASDERLRARASWQRAAEILARVGAPEEALQIVLARGHEHEAAELLQKLAPGLVATGRGAVYRESLAKLTEGERDARPLLSYWLGMSLMAVDVGAARAAHERAYAGFVRDGDPAGQAMAASGVLQTFLIGGDDDRDLVRRWLAPFDRLLAREPAFPSPAVAARVHATLVGVMFHMAPTHALFGRCVARLEELLAQPADDDTRIAAAGQLCEYYAMAGLALEAKRLIAATEALVRRSSVSPRERTYWLMRASRLEEVVGDLRGARAKLEQALDIAKQYHRGPGGFLACIFLADLALDTGDLEAAARLAEEAPEHVPTYVQSLRPIHGPAAWVHFTLGKCAALEGDLDRALRELELAHGNISEALVIIRWLHGIGLVSVLVEGGDLARARAVLDGCRGTYGPEHFPYMAFVDAAMDAVVAEASGESPRLDVVRARLQTLQESGMEIPVLRQTVAARQIAELLLRHRIETEYVRSWIRRVHMKPRSSDARNWPWPVRIHTLGPSRIEIDGMPLRFAGKAPRRSLELLNAIVAFGGIEVPSEQLRDALWADSDGDKAEASLQMALSRLRKLLTRNSVLQRQGKISLDRTACWVDVWSFQNVCAAIDGRRGDGHAERLLDVYRGPFLANEPEEPWMLPVRAQLRRQFARAVATLGARLEGDRRAADVAALRHAAEERDPLAFVASE